MDKLLEWKIRKLGPTPAKVLEHVIQYSTPTSAGTILDLDMGEKEVGGGYSVLSRGGLVYPLGRDEDGSIKWEPAEEVKKNKDEVLGLLKKIK